MFYRKLSLLLIVISICFSSIRANAQIPSFGVKAGLNLANVYGRDASKPFPGNEIKPGLVVGAYMTYSFVPLLSIQPEVLFSMKGTKGTQTPPYSTVPIDYTQTFNYIEVPVLLKLNLPVGPALPFSPTLFAGPDFAFNVASKEELTYQGAPSSVTMDTKYLTRSFDFNVAVGLGGTIGIGPANLGLELRYTFGTGSLLKAGEGNVKNGVFAVMASVGI